MAVAVKWEDGNTAEWEMGVTWDRSLGARSSFVILDAEGVIVVEVPDFGVRYVQLVKHDGIDDSVEVGPVTSETWAVGSVGVA